MFLIRFIEEPILKVESEEEGLTGILHIGQHQERFVSHLLNWSETDYAQHWREALWRALDHKPAALITDMWRPSQNSFLDWWPMWRVGRNVVFHNQLFFFGKYGIDEDTFTLERLFDFIGPRLTHNEDGVPISEWHVPTSDIEEFLKKKGTA